MFINMDKVYTHKFLNLKPSFRMTGPQSGLLCPEKCGPWFPAPVVASPLSPQHAAAPFPAAWPPQPCPHMAPGVPPQRPLTLGVKGKKKGLNFE